MSRQTTARVWTEAEDAYARRLSDAADRARAGSLPYSVDLLRVARLPRVTVGDRLRGYDRMTRAAIIHPDRHPGRALIHHPRRGYLSTDDELLVLEGLLPMIKRMHTTNLRAQAVASVLDPRSLVGSSVRSYLGAAGLAFGESVWDTIIGHVEDSRR